MTEPIIAKRGPYPVDEEPGHKVWCACGRSKKDPYCDGSHKGTGITPVRVEITEAKRVFWCGCKHTGGQPFCDGSHSRLDA